MDKVWMVFWTVEDRVTGEIEHGALSNVFATAEIAEMYAASFFISDASMEFYEELGMDDVLFDEKYVVPSLEFPAYLTETWSSETMRLFTGRIASWKQETLPMEWAIRIYQVEVLS